MPRSTDTIILRRGRRGHYWIIQAPNRETLAHSEVYNGPRSLRNARATAKARAQAWRCRYREVLK